MEENNKIFYNFPICLLEDFHENTTGVLSDLLDYCVYSHNLKVNDIEKTQRYLQVDILNKEAVLKSGEKLYYEHQKEPMTGVEKNIYWSFLKTNKTDFEKDCFLAFCAIKSIIGDSAYCKITDNFIVSRMAGLVRIADEKNQIPERLQKYWRDKKGNNYHLTKLKNALQIDWSLSYYSNHTRGGYYSFRLDLETLILHAEEKRGSYKENELKKRKEEALKSALSRLKPP